MSDINTDAPVVASDAPQVTTPAPAPTVGTESPKPEGATKEPVSELPYDQWPDEVKRSFQKRIAKESKRIERLNRAEVERDYFKRIAEERQAPQGKPTTRDGPPKAEDFGNDYEAYEDARLEYKLEQKLKALGHQSEKQSQESSEVEYAKKAYENLQKGADKYPDFDEVVTADEAQFTKPMAAAIAESDLAADVAYHLATNLAELNRIRALSPTQQVRAIAAIESTLKARPAPTKVPPPIVPSSGASAGSGKLSEMSDDAYAKAMRKATGRA